MLGPDDLVGLMTPDMSPEQITFMRKTQAIEEGLRKNWAWGRKNTLKLDAAGTASTTCASTRRRPRQEIIARRRERVALDSLRDLILHMASIREGRTAVLTISEGWVLVQTERDAHAPQQRIRSRASTTEPTPGTPPPVGVGPGGTLTTKDPNRQYDDRPPGMRSRSDGARDGRQRQVLPRHPR